MIKDWRQVLPYCVVRLDERLAPSVVYHYLKFERDWGAMGRTKKTAVTTTDNNNASTGKSRVSGVTKSTRSASSLSSALQSQQNLPIFGAKPKTRSRFEESFFPCRQRCDQNSFQLLLCFKFCCSLDLKSRFDPG